MCTYVRSFEVLVFFCTVFYSVQLVLFNIRCLRMFFSDYVKERILFYHRSKKNSAQIVRCLAEEGHTASKVGVMKFLRRYRETGTIARVPGTGRASKVTSEIRMVKSRWRKTMNRQGWSSRSYCRRRSTALTHLCPPYFVEERPGMDCQRNEVLSDD